MLCTLFLFGRSASFLNADLPYLPLIFQQKSHVLSHASHDRYKIVNVALKMRFCAVCVIDKSEEESVDNILELVFLFVRGVSVDSLEDIVACPAAHFLNVHICNSEVIGCACENVPMGADKACAFYSFLS